MRIVFYLGPSFERWNPETALKSGTGGSELMAIDIAEHLASVGHQVVVYNDCGDELSGIFSEVEYRPYHTFGAGPRSDVLVVYRRPEALDQSCRNMTGGIVFVATDKHYEGDLTPERIELVDGWIVVSEWHKDRFTSVHPNIPIDKIVVIPNGVPVELFRSLAKEEKRILGRLSYTSAPDRGLEIAIEAMPKIREEFPYAELHVFHGFLTPKALAVQNRNTTAIAHMKRLESMLEEYKPHGVVYRGRVGQQELYRELLKTDVWVYPATVEETSCIAAMEAHVAGCSIVVSSLGALPETCGVGTATILSVCDHATVAQAVTDKLRAPSSTRVRVDWKFDLDETLRHYTRQICGGEPNNKPNPTICLAMFVKDEAHVIGRCLDSVKGFISHWVMVDTGSTDNTMDIIREKLAGIPGTLYEHPFRGFSENRTEAVQLARQTGAGFVLLLDADMEVTFQELPGRAGIRFNELGGHEMYHLINRQGSLEYVRGLMLALWLPWEFVGMNTLHELPSVPGRSWKQETIRDFVIIKHADGGRGNDPLSTVMRYTREAEMLEKELVADPHNPRVAFYLAQSYRDAALMQKSLEMYQRRAKMGAFAEEVYVSLVEAAKIIGTMTNDMAEVQAAFDKAHQARPTRAEGDHAGARYFRLHGDYARAAELGRRASQVPFPKGDLLFVEFEVYEWRAKEEYGLALSWLGQNAEAHKIFKELLPRVPAGEQKRVQDNIDFCFDRIEIDLTKHRTGFAQIEEAAPSGLPELQEKAVASGLDANMQQQSGSYIGILDAYAQEQAQQSQDVRDSLAQQVFDGAAVARGLLAKLRGPIDAKIAGGWVLLMPTLPGVAETLGIYRDAIAYALDRVAGKDGVPASGEIWFGTHEERCPAPPPDAIIYQSEVGSSRWLQDPEYRRRLANAREVWDYSAFNLAFYQAKKKRHVPLRYSPTLVTFPEVEKDIPLGVVASVNDRRREVFDKGPVDNRQGIYGAERDLFQARVRVHVVPHYYDNAPVEQARIGQLLANGCAVVAEHAPDHYDYPGPLYMRFVSMAATAQGLLNSGLWKTLGRQGKEKFMARTMEQALVEAFREHVDATMALQLQEEAAQHRQAMQKRLEEHNKSQTKPKAESAAEEEIRLFEQEPMVTSALKNRDPVKLNLGCSDNHKPGYVNVDRVLPADLIANLALPWPWPDSSVDEIVAHDFIEHLPDKIMTMNEAWRVLKPGGVFDIVVPTTDGRGAWQDPTHVSYWNPNSFWYFTDGDAHRERFGDAYGVKARFRVLEKRDISAGGHSDIKHFAIRLGAVKQPLVRFSMAPVDGRVIEAIAGGDGSGHGPIRTGSADSKNSAIDLMPVPPPGQQAFVAMLRVKNEERWIERCIRSLRPLCGDRIYVMDDGSTDATRDIVRAEGARLYLSPFVGQGYDEVRDKNFLFNHVHKDVPHNLIGPNSPFWVIHIDGDEELAEGTADEIRLRAKESGQNAFNFQIVYLWDREDQARVDGVYGHFKRESMFRMCAHDLRFEGAPVSARNVPMKLMANAAPHGELRILHYGYLEQETRIRKYRFYNGKIDPGNAMEDNYRHIIQGDGGVDGKIVEPYEVLRHAGPLTLRSVRKGFGK